MVNPEIWLRELKSRVEFYPAGRIVPQRVLKGPRKQKHRAVFGSNSWLVPTVGGYVVLVDCGVNGVALRLHSNLRNVHLQGSPYSVGGTHWIGNAGYSAQEYAEYVMSKLTTNRDSNDTR